MAKLHHLTLVVEDLSQRQSQFEALLGAKAVEEALPERGVITARFLLGDVLLILVQPTRQDCVPAEYLRARGEGVFMLSLTSSSLEASDHQLKERGFMLDWDTLRTGLDGWRVADVKDETSLPLVVQFAQTQSSA